MIKALEVYKGFEANYGSFTAAVEVKIDPVQYWRDRPLYLKTIPSTIKQIQTSIKNPDIKEVAADYYLEQLQQVGVQVEIYREQIAEIVKDIEKYSEINNNEGLDIQFPQNNPDEIDIAIKDADGNVISTIVTDTHARENNITPEGEKPVTLLDGLPSDYTDDKNIQKADEPLITSLPDSYIKNKLWIANHYNEVFMEDAFNAASHFQEELETLAKNIEIPDNKTPEEIDKTIDDFWGEDIQIWYGIPLINLSPEDVPIEDAVILQIDTKHDWTLNVTNIVGVEPNNQELRIKDVQINPGRAFTAGIFVQGNSMSIYLVMDGDPKIYKHTIVLAQPPKNLELVSYGSDSHGLKRICGDIYDYFFWQQPTEYVHKPGGALPQGPSDGHVYDGASPRVRGRKYYPRKNWEEPAYNGGDWFQLNDNFRFVYNGYLEGFFCKDNIKYTDFTIMWYQYQLGYPAGIRTLVADSINNNYIRYDYDNFELLIDFNNVHYREHITLPEFMWFQVAVRYKMDTNTLVFSFIDFWGDLYEEVYLDIGADLNFELISLWGRYNRETKYYTEVGKGIFGLVIIQEKYMTTAELFELYKNHKSFLKDYNPRYMELPS